MSKDHKIIKYNLQDEVIQLKKMKYSNKDIAKIVADNHPDIEEVQNLSDASVFRFLESYREGKIESEVKMGGNPINDFIQDYRDYMDDLQTKADDLYNRAIKIADDIEKSTSPSNIDRLKAVDVAIKAIDQLKKNKVALMQFGEGHIRDIVNVNLKKEFNVRNLLINCTRRLCPKCRKEVLKELELIEDGNKK